MILWSITSILRYDKNSRRWSATITMWGPLFGNTVRMCCMQNCALHALPWPLFVSIFFNYLVDLCRLDSGVKKWDEKLETTVIIRGGGKKGIVWWHGLGKRICRWQRGQHEWNCGGESLWCGVAGLHCIICVWLSSWGAVIFMLVCHSSGYKYWW